MSMPTAVHVTSADGWRVRADIITSSEGAQLARGPAALLVPATKHERDAYGTTLVAELVARGFTVMLTDIRGRGDSCLPLALHAFPPGQLRNVVDDVAAAMAVLAEHPTVDPTRLVVFTEQDTADAAATAALADPRVIGLVLISAKLSAATLELVAARAVPVCGLVVKEEPVSLRAVVGAHTRAEDHRSRLRVLGGVGSGTTMFSAWQYLHRSEPPLEQWLAAWAASICSADQPSSAQTTHGGPL